MTQTALRETSLELARRIRSSRLNPAGIDEAGQTASDVPPTSIEYRAQMTAADLDVIDEAVKHYAACSNG